MTACKNLGMNSTQMHVAIVDTSAHSVKVGLHVSSRPCAQVFRTGTNAHALAPLSREAVICFPVALRPLYRSYFCSLYGFYALMSLDSCCLLPRVTRRFCAVRQTGPFYVSVRAVRRAAPVLWCGMAVMRMLFTI